MNTPSPATAVTLGAVYLGTSIAGLPLLVRLLAVGAGYYLLEQPQPAVPHPVPQGIPSAAGRRPIGVNEALIRFRRGQFGLPQNRGLRMSGCGCAGCASCRT